MTIKQNMNTKDKLKRVSFNLLNIEVVAWSYVDCVYQLG